MSGIGVFLFFEGSPIKFWEVEWTHTRQWKTLFFLANEDEDETSHCLNDIRWIHWTDLRTGSDLFFSAITSPLLAPWSQWKKCCWVQRIQIYFLFLQFKVSVFKNVFTHRSLHKWNAPLLFYLLPFEMHADTFYEKKVSKEELLEPSVAQKKSRIKKVLSEDF